VRDVGALVLQRDLAALRAVIKDKESSVLKVWVASCAVKAIEKGDAHTLDVLLNRFIGKVQESVRTQLTGANGEPLNLAAAPVQIVLTMPDNGRSVQAIATPPPQLPSGQGK
jgi:hypothetical protein